MAVINIAVNFLLYLNIFLYSNELSIYCQIFFYAYWLFGNGAFFSEGFIKLFEFDIMETEVFMKSVRFFCVAGVFCAMFLLSCASNSVKRVPADKLTDLDGYWNDNDVRIVCDNLIQQCASSAFASNYYRRNSRNPVVIVGQIKNASDEHIDTTLVSNYLRNAIINSGEIDFVSSSDERLLLREERLDQADNASEETAKAIGNETGADAMMIGSVRTIVQKLDNQSVRAYFVNVELHDLESNRILWSGEDSSIKKVITRPKVKL